MERTELILRILLMLPKGCLRFIASKDSRLSLFFVLALADGLPKSLRVLELQLDLFFPLNNSTGDISVDRIDELAFLEHLPGDCLTCKEPAEILNRHSFFEAAVSRTGQKAEFLAQHVIEPANLVR